MEKEQILADLKEMLQLMDRIREEGQRSYLVEKRQIIENRLRKEVGLEVTRY